MTEVSVLPLAELVTLAVPWRVAPREVPEVSALPMARMLWLKEPSQVAVVMTLSPPLKVKPAA